MVTRSPSPFGIGIPPVENSSETANSSIFLQKSSDRDLTIIFTDIFGLPTIPLQEENIDDLRILRRKRDPRPFSYYIFVSKTHNVQKTRTFNPSFTKDLNVGVCIIVLENSTQRVTITEEKSMNKTEEFYKEILKEKVVDVEDLKSLSEKVLEREDHDEYYYRKYTHKLLNEGKVGKIRRGLYYGIPLDQLGEKFEVDRYIAGNKIKKGDALAYHTALELHGAAHSAHSKVFVLVTKEDRFRKFNFQDVEYVPVLNQHEVGHITSIGYENTNLSVTDRARTFVDCLSRTDLCGGWEECLKSLADLKNLSLSDIKEVLSSYGNKTLELKCGYVLELLSDSSPYYDHIQKEELEPLKPSPDWKPVYIDRDVPSELKEDWGLYIPEGLEDLLRGV